MAEKPSPPGSPLEQPVTTLWGVGGDRAAQLGRLRVRTVEDLLLHRPRRYEDRRHFKPIANLTRDEPALTRGTVVAQGLKRFRRGATSVFELLLDDGSARLHCRWWNLPFMENYFAVGDDVLVYGKLREMKPRTMDHPETEVVEADEESSVHMNRIVPVYRLTEGLPQRWLRGLIRRTIERYERDVMEPVDGLQVGSASASAGGECSTSNVQRLTLKVHGVAREIAAPSRANAMHMLHCPEALEDIEIARQRLALDEFVALQRDIRKRRMRFEAKSHGLPCRGDNHLIKPFLAELGFALTGAQTRVLREIRHDMGGAHPMRRLLQGDVGSGKTAVAACAALMALESGFNVVLMAPTEILAEQHFRNFTGWLHPLGVQVELQTGSRKTFNVQSSTLNLETATAGSLDATHSPSANTPRRAGDRQHGRLFIGTHAVIESGFNVEHLGLVIVDEQHKFGVTQREQLVRKGNYPHLLVMTATPIPRTLGLTLYGDLDLSVIDEMPAGRGRVRTFVRPADKLPKVWDFVRSRLDEGRQAYVVYPRVEETSGGTAKAVHKERERVQSVLAPHKVGLLHGRLKAAGKESVMADFRANRIQALVATSLIEVGVDVGNATVMVIENAEQFGLAQLHQLRGRIGRGAHESHCILVSEAGTLEARERLRVLEETLDGFRIAEADLQLRGPGELLGQLQSGAPRFRFADLARDFDLVKLARDLVAAGATQTVFS